MHLVDRRVEYSNLIEIFTPNYFHNLKCRCKVRGVYPVQTSRICLLF